MNSRRNQMSPVSQRVRTTAPGVPKNGVPALLRHAVPLHESVRVDLHVPGCPPKPDAIAFVLKELLDGHKIDLTGQVKFG